MEKAVLWCGLCVPASRVGYMIMGDGWMDLKKCIEVTKTPLEPTLGVMVGDTNSDGVCFQQDTAPSLKSRTIISWLEKNSIELLNWPLKS